MNSNVTISFQKCLLPITKLCLQLNRGELALFFKGGFVGMKGPVRFFQTFNFYLPFQRCLIGAPTARRSIRVALTITMVLYMTVRWHLRYYGVSTW